MAYCPPGKLFTPASRLPPPPPPSKATFKTPPMQIDNSFSVYLFLDSGP